MSIVAVVHAFSLLYGIKLNYYTTKNMPSPISDEPPLSTKTQEVPPAATQEMTNAKTGEELQAQVESLVHPVANSEPPVTTRKEHPSKTREEPAHHN